MGVWIYFDFLPDPPKRRGGRFYIEANETTCSAELVEEQVEEQVIKRILDYCSVPRTRTELQELAKISGRKAFVEKYLKPLQASGKLVMTVPDKPNSRNQKYVKPRT